MDYLCGTFLNLLPNRPFSFPHMDTMITYVERAPLFVNKIGGNSQMKMFEKIWITFLIGSGCFFRGINKFFNWSQVSDLHTFLHFVQDHFVIITSCCYVWYVWRNTNNVVTTGDMERFDTRSRIENGDTTDLFSCLWLLFLPLTWSARYSFALFTDQPISNLFIFSLFVIINNGLSQMLLMKYAVVKRLAAIRKRMDGSDIFSAYPSVRALLRLNEKVNYFYSPLLFFWTLLNFLSILTNVSDVWNSQVHCKEAINTTWHAHTSWSVLSGLSYLHHLVMFARASVGNEVDALDHEMDRSISDFPLTTSDEPGPSHGRLVVRPEVKPIEERKKIFALMQELAATPVEPTALGLFSVSCASLTSGLGLLLELALVLIQLLR